MYPSVNPERAKTHPDVALCIRSIASLSMRHVIGTLPKGSEIRIFGPLVQGRYRTNYRRVFCPDSPLHGGFIAVSINNLPLVEILREETDLAAS